MLGCHDGGGSIGPAPFFYWRGAVRPRVASLVVTLVAGAHLGLAGCDAGAHCARNGRPRSWGATFTSAGFGIARCLTNGRPRAPTDGGGTFGINTWASIFLSRPASKAARWAAFGCGARLSGRTRAGHRLWQRCQTPLENASGAREPGMRAAHAIHSCVPATRASHASQPREPAMRAGHASLARQALSVPRLAVRTNYAIAPTSAATSCLHAAVCARRSYSTAATVAAATAASSTGATGAAVATGTRGGALARRRCRGC